MKFENVHPQQCGYFRLQGPNAAQVRSCRACLLSSSIRATPGRRSSNMSRFDRLWPGRSTACASGWRRTRRAKAYHGPRHHAGGRRGRRAPRDVRAEQFRSRRGRESAEAGGAAEAPRSQGARCTTKSRCTSKRRNSSRLQITARCRLIVAAVFLRFDDRSRCGLCAAHGGSRNTPVEGNKPPFMLHCEGEEIHIGDLARPQNAAMVEDIEVSDR